MKNEQERFDKNWDDFARHAGFTDEREMLTVLYIDQHLSLKKIGARLGCSPHAIRHHLIERGIDRRTRGGDNNNANQTRKLFRLDQRVVLFGNLREVAELAGVSTSLLWKYRRLIKEDKTWTSVYSPRSTSSSSQNSVSTTCA